MEGEVWEALLAGVLEDVSLLGEGFEDWPQPARTVNRAREAARAPASFRVFPVFIFSSLLEVKRNITKQVKNSKNHTTQIKYTKQRIYLG